MRTEMREPSRMPDDDSGQAEERDDQPERRPKDVAKHHAVTHGTWWHRRLTKDTQDELLELRARDAHRVETYSARSVPRCRPRTTVTGQRPVESFRTRS